MAEDKSADEFGECNRIFGIECAGKWGTLKANPRCGEATGVLLGLELKAGIQPGQTLFGLGCSKTSEQHL